MSKEQPKVEITNEHREALALAAHEYSAQSRESNLEAWRLVCNSMESRNNLLNTPGIMQRYINIRGFDPRMVHAAPKLRWIN